MGAEKNCSEMNPLDDLKFEMGGQIFTIPMNSTFYQTTTALKPPKRGHHVISGKPLCILLIENLHKRVKSDNYSHPSVPSPPSHPTHKSENEVSVRELRATSSVNRR